MKNIVHIYGGLGNQMFQFAFYKFLLAQEPETYISTGYFDNRLFKPEHASVFLLSGVFKNITIPSVDDWKSKTVYSDKIVWRLFRIVRKLYYRKNKIIDTFDFHEKYESGDSTTKNSKIHYRSYWQGIEFVQRVENELRNLYRFNLNEAGEKNRMCVEEMNRSNSVAIHVRRGDYLLNKDIYGGICTIKYYEEAISRIEQKIQDPYFFIFSDDTEWCMENFKHLEKIKYVDWNIRDPHYDMYLMSQCKHNIIANSSFSWWSAWLNENEEKTVIIPKKWNKYMTSDELIESNWIQL